MQGDAAHALTVAAPRISMRTALRMLPKNIFDSIKRLRYAFNTWIPQVGLKIPHGYSSRHTSILWGGNDSRSHTASKAYHGRTDLQRPSAHDTLRLGSSVLAPNGTPLYVQYVLNRRRIGTSKSQLTRIDLAVCAPFARTLALDAPPPCGRLPRVPPSTRQHWHMSGCSNP
ncbi:hypothetical protein PYCCODRAFT_1163789 [Trametes coccinea BRFM310]|uniref:Uncharacterized protein n=1 Tax=Trametes coccinea (strain BRFM310) TaxID=1353009 RepID=A0A1Y2IZM9_TRAC3|nr:hypothetical protein PYCCODRAFT_1163789 [Trametes coccinea BRFM310]